MTTSAQTEESGHARYLFCLRLSRTARHAFEAEWDRCCWIWNELVARSKAVHRHSRTAGESVACGPAQLEKMLTGARAGTPWLVEGAGVPRQQVIRDFAKSRAKALGEIKAGLPMR